MAVENGEWIKHWQERRDPGCLHSPDKTGSIRRKKKETPPYPQNLLKDVFDPCKYRGEFKIDTENLSNDQLIGLEHVLATLSEREQDVLRLRYRKNMFYREISARVHCTGSCVGQILKRTIRHLRASRMDLKSLRENDETA